VTTVEIVNAILYI